jgi:hypothetical protein
VQHEAGKRHDRQVVHEEALPIDGGIRSVAKAQQDGAAGMRRDAG